MKTLSHFIHYAWRKLNRKKQQKKFIECLKEFNEQRILNQQLSESTKKKYEYFFQNVNNFFLSKHLTELTVNEVRVPLFEEMRRWLHSNLKSCGKTHSSRHLEMCISAMDYAVRNEWAKYNPITSLETGRDKRKSVINLEEHELKKFISYDFKNETFKKVQVLYTFQSATGLSYGNLYDYETKIDSESGGLWIEDKRKKVGNTPFFVPLDAPGFEIAKIIHVSYKGQLPKMENGSYNRFLKEMASILNINKKLTTHTARKTFATLMDQKGFSLGVISSMLGNSETVCKEHYINVSKKKIVRAMQDRTESRLRAA